MARFDLSDEEWAIIAPLLTQQGRGPERKDDRKVLNGIFYILRTGAPWRNLPERYSPRTTVYNRYVRWGERGVWQGIFETLAQECEVALVFIDASMVKAHRAAAGSKKGELEEGISLSRGGRTSKVHAAVDATGHPLRLAISGGQLHDTQIMDELSPHPSLLFEKR